ncbi:CrcB-like protein-domain-containing protein [Xylariaceae sp. FL0662B]|nr:CrcB-like protein-domain-containing protein [Xylariaceae sp. FL0662B]
MAQADQENSSSSSDWNPHDAPEKGHDPDPDEQSTRNSSSQAIQNVASVPSASNNADELQRRASGLRAPSRRASSRRASSQQSPRRRRRSSQSSVDYDIPDSYVNLTELISISPVQSRRDVHPPYRSLEEERTFEQAYIDEQLAQARIEEPAEKRGRWKVSRLATEIYTVSYLILFAILGTLARLGLQALTYYPGAPVVFSSLWPNFTGSLVFGFLAEDRMLFRYEWGTPTYEQQLLEARERNSDEEAGACSPGNPDAVDLTAAKKAYLATKKTIPLYIGLTTGFCGSITSFSAFVRDMFLALSNDITLSNTDFTNTSTNGGDSPRNGGDSLMALLAVIIATVALSLGGMHVGAHLAIALEPIVPSFPYPLMRKFIDRVSVFLAWGCWLGAVLLCVFPPDRFTDQPESWRGRATFALTFAPLGCLGRFYASLHLNGRVPSFPLGTFAVNILGTAFLGMAWDLAHVSEGGVVGCQVLQGIEDGFCGCLTTVSTWVTELAALRRGHAYIYGGASVLVGLACIVAIMGGLRWTHGFDALQCLN